QDISLRQLVVQSGQSLAEQFQLVRGKMNDLARDVDDKTAALVTDANGLADQVADLNRQIIRAEGGAGGPANGLRDQRDAVLKRLSTLMDVHVIPQDNGGVNVYAGSEPLVLQTQNRGVVLKTTTDPVTGKTVKVAAFRADNGEMPIASGQLGSLLQIKAQIDGTNDSLDGLAHNLIFELNKLHAGGQGLQYLSDVTGANAAQDPAAVLTSTAAGLKFQPANGTFVVHVRQKATGLETSTLVKVDLDGLNGDDTTLNGLATSLNAVAGISASVVAGKLKVSADSAAVEFAFSQDSSGALAALGVNTFYTGTDARDIAVAAAVKADPRLVAAAKNGQPADNQTAQAIAALESKAVAALNGATLKDTYAGMVNTVAIGAAAARTNAEAAHAVNDTLVAQREALSGVSMDEEAINLMRQQRAFQGASRLISIVNELMDTVMGLVR
ncbi:MAG TPA: flagellar basal body rod C-terminal domain-containing protein, partial [Tepidisphaeraceae bacterium]|nr:flagellar basal body rod C-terminal domain-containing protein [Tepidisphaeraceae bacterium]